MIAAWALAGLVVLGIALNRTLSAGWPGATAIWFASVFAVVMAISWIWPITLYIGGESDAIDFDEGFLVLFLLLIPAPMTVLAFAAVTIAGQAIKRRPLAKSIFNVGQVVTSAGVGALVFVLLHGSTDTVGYAKVGAAIVGALCYFVVNTGSMVTIMTTLGTPWRSVVFGGIEGKVLIAAGGICVAIPAGLLLSQHPRYLPVALLPAIILRFVGAGHFFARHDRARLHGLFDATLDVNRSMGTDETTAAVLNAASSLLRSPDASLGVERAHWRRAGGADGRGRRHPVAPGGRAQPDRALRRRRPDAPRGAGLGGIDRAVQHQPLRRGAAAEGQARHHHEQPG